MNRAGDVKVYSPYVEGAPSSSTYNITNNNNINYNYGSNITAISSDNNQSHIAPASTLNRLGGALSAVTNSEYITNATKFVQSSNVLQNANDTIKRTVGVDIRKYVGGKSAVEIAEERLRQEQEQNYRAGGGGY
jgi:hypothetical protein